MRFGTLFENILETITYDKSGKKVISKKTWIHWSEAAFAWCNDEEIEGKRDAMLDTVRYFYREEIAPHMNGPDYIEDFETYSEAEDDALSATGQNDKLTRDQNSVKNKYRRWINGRQAPSAEKLAKFAVFASFLIMHARDADFVVPVTKGEVYFCDFDFSPKALIRLCADSLGVMEEEDLQAIEGDERFFLLLVFAAMMNARHPDLRINRLYLEYLYREQGLELTEDLEALKTKYLRYLIEETHEMNLRDVDIKLRRDICDFYVVPRFSCNGQPKVSPVSEDASDRIVIRSETGRGKTLLLQALSLCAGEGSLNQDRGSYKNIRRAFGLADHGVLPVLVRAESLNKLMEESAEKKISENLLLEAAMRLNISKPGANLSVDQMKSVLKLASKTGKLLFLFDAYDELAYGKRKSFRTSMESVMARYPESKILMTSRNIDFENFDYDFFRTFELYWEIEPFNEKDIRRLCRKWKASSGASDQDIDALADAIVGNDYIHRLATNPYMLSQIISIRDANWHAPASEVLPTIINKLIAKRWDVEAYDLELEKSKILERIHKAMAQVASLMFLNGGSHEMRLDDFEGYVEKATLDVFEKEFSDRIIGPFITDIKTKSGLLIATDRGYEFQNRMIEAYLVAEGIVDQLKKKMSQPRPVELQGLMEEMLRTMERHDADQGAERTVHELQKKLSQPRPMEIQGLMEEMLSSINRFDGFLADVFIMLFSILGAKPSKEGALYSREIYGYLLSRVCGSTYFEDNGMLLRVFSGLLTNTFGKNGLTNNSIQKGNMARSQMVGLIGVFSGLFPEPLLEIREADWLKDDVQRWEKEEGQTWRKP